MKVARLVLKFVALGLMIAASICAVIAYWDKLTQLVQGTAHKVHVATASFNPEYDDYAE